MPGTEYGQSSFSIALSGSGERPEDVDLADLVNQSVQPPLYIHFQFRAQREAVHALVHTDIGKDWLHDAKPPGIDALALFSIDLRLHLIQ